nr:autotransporter outer membrane beta-barrel domain-containing protein [Pseudomonas sp. C2B4]
MALLLAGSSPAWSDSVCEEVEDDPCNSPAYDGLIIEPATTYSANINTLANVTVEGGTMLAHGSATLENTIINSGLLDVSDRAIASHTILNGGTVNLACNDTEFCNATANGTTVNGGLMEIYHTSTANQTTINGGIIETFQEARVYDTTINNGQVFLRESSSAIGSILNNGQLTLADNATAQDTTVNGGYMSLWGNAVADMSQINRGGTIEGVAGTQMNRTIVDDGGLMVLGNGAEASDTIVNDGGLLRLRGDAILGGDNHLYGQVRFADPATRFHTLTIKGQLSGNSQFLMNTDLAAHEGDRINVLSEIRGSHTLLVADSGNAPQDLTGLLLVDGNGGSGKFQLQGETVDAGAFRYELQLVGDDWYLLNTGKIDPTDEPGEQAPPVYSAPPAVPPLPPVFPVAPVEPSNPLPPPHRPQAETLSKGANAAVASQAANAALIDAQMSATVGHFSDLRSGQDQGGLWTRGYGAEQRLDSGSSRAFEQQANGMEIGADGALPFANGTLYIGGLVGQGQGQQAFGEASQGTIDSTTLGGYASYLDRNGLYVDGALKYSHLDNDINITSNLGQKVTANYTNHAVSAQAQIGKQIDLGQGWFVEPQAGLQVARISEGRYTASNGLSVEQDAMISVQSRIGGMLGRELHLDNGVAVKPYAKATWIIEHAGHSQVTVNGAKLDSRLPGSRAEIGGGVRVTAADKHDFFVEGRHTQGSDIEQPWAVSVGYRYNW